MFAVRLRLDLDTSLLYGTICFHEASAGPAQRRKGLLHLAETYILSIESQSPTSKPSGFESQLFPTTWNP